MGYSNTPPKQVRKPVLAAARTGAESEIDTALLQVSDLRHLEGLKHLAGDRYWGKELGPQKAELLLGRINTRLEALKAASIDAPQGEIVKPPAPQIVTPPRRDSRGGRGASEPLPIYPPDEFPEWRG